ncbi:MAG: primosomal protein N' [bacterium]
MIAKVVVDVAVDKEFDYLIPDSLSAQVKLGSRVNLSFGSRTTQGYVVGFSASSGHPKLKAIESVVGEKPYIDETLLKLARWMGDYYCAPVELAVQAVLPGAVRHQKAKFKEQLFVEEVRSQESGVRSQKSIKSCEAPVVTGVSPVLAIEDAAETAATTKRTPKQAAVMSVLSQYPAGLFLHELIKLSGVDSATVRALEKKGLVRIGKQAAMRDPFANQTILKTESLVLMPEQAAALAVVKEAIDGARIQNAEKEEHRTFNIEHSTSNKSAKAQEFNVQCSMLNVGSSRCPSSHPSVILLHGVTGSGKTEVYLQAISHALTEGLGAIVLVPEIALTPQTIERFRGRFGDIIAVLHSHLSDGERHDEWHRIHSGQARIVIGARSAVFAPIQNLGLIVVDEEHEHTYKQEEAPRYNARDVAVMRGHLEGCAVVLGSATPALESFQNAKIGKYKLVEMMHRVDHRAMPHMRIVDMRVEAERTGRVSIFSRDLVEAVKNRLTKAEQVILFLNRRGYASSLVCSKCGYVAQCNDCSVAQTYHRQDETLKCHICGLSQGVPARCPGCQDPAFKFSGIGTQRVEIAVAKIFPGARVVRMDADATRGKDSHRRILGEFKTGRIDILVGTQMIAKGLDFPNVTLIGVLNADLSLHMPDFRAGERTFQLLTQVAGRAGRGEVPGEVIVQTFTPFHQAIQAARRLDYDGFCDQENEFRRELGYPPFGHLVCVGIRGSDQIKVLQAADEFAKLLAPRLPTQVVVNGPAPAPLEKAKGQFRHQIILKAPTTKAITRVLREAIREFRWPTGVNVSIDVDAVSLM